MVEGGHGGGHGGPERFFPESHAEQQMGEAFMSFFEALFLITLIKAGTGNMSHNKAPAHH